MVSRAGQPDDPHAAPPQRSRRRIEGHEIVLRDHYGIARVIITGGSEEYPGPSLVMLDDQATIRLRIGLSTHPTKNPRVALYDKNGKERVAVAVNDHEDGTQAATITLHDGEENPTIGLMTQDKGPPAITLFDNAGNLRIGAGFISDDQPFVGVIDDDGVIIPGAALPQALIETLTRCQDCQKQHQCPSDQPPKDDEQKGATS